MDKSKTIFGIDISKNTFDVMDSNGKHSQFENNSKGYPKFLKLLNSDSHCVMEATGYYHYQLAHFLVEHNILTSVENPLSIKRFIQMKLLRIKTDKSDAKMICQYGQERKLQPWVGYTKNQMECFQLIRLLDTYTKQSTADKNKLQAEQTLGNPSTDVVKSLERSLEHLKKESEMIEKSLLKLVKEDYQQMLTHLLSIPCIGEKTAISLLVVTDGFTRFESAAQLISFCGLSPTKRQSGTSINGRSRISKVGNVKLRNLLFMCSFTACKHNDACKALYERITNQGKSSKLALTAVSNKLIKQAFAIAKSGVEYNKNHRSKLAIAN